MNLKRYARPGPIWGAYDYLQVYDSVLVYGCQDVYDAEAAYDLSPRAQEVTFCNYVAPREQAIPIAQEDGDPFVLVMGGGGADAFPLAKAFLDAMPELVETTSLRALIITGPNMPANDREVLIAQAEGQAVEIRTSVEDPTALLNQATAVVTMGGYNGLVEVLQWRKKALVVPRRAPSAEQQLRTTLFAGRGLVRMLNPESLSADSLRESLLALLEDDGIPSSADIPSLDGSRRAALIC